MQHRILVFHVLWSWGITTTDLVCRRSCVCLQLGMLNSIHVHTSMCNTEEGQPCCGRDAEVSGCNTVNNDGGDYVFDYGDNVRSTDLFCKKDGSDNGMCTDRECTSSADCDDMDPCTAGKCKQDIRGDRRCTFARVAVRCTIGFSWATRLKPSTMFPPWVGVIPVACIERLRTTASCSS